MAMITFAADMDVFKKRKRVYRACNDCKRKRKRCSHALDHVEHVEGSSSERPTSSSSNQQERPVNTSHQASQSTSQTPTSDPSALLKDSQPSTLTHSTRDPDHSRFIGYLSPEAILRGQAREQRETDSRSGIEYLGSWVHRTQSQDADRIVQDGQSSVSSAPSVPNAQEDNAVAQNLLRAYLDALGVHEVPPKGHQDTLIGIYFRYIHPIIPLIHESDFKRQYTEGKESKVLVQAICIVAAKHDQAKLHLFLGKNSKLFTPRDFSTRLYTSVNAALLAKLERDRITLIQTLALLSLHCEGFDGSEQASMHLAQAIHHAHTMGLQIGGKQNARERSHETVFWCLWSLDKVMTCMNGRPLIINDNDIHIPKPAETTGHRTPFGIWLRLAEAMDKVIYYYRPGIPLEETGWEVDFPSFEDIIGEGGDNIDAPIIAVLELFYHAVAMTSHRFMNVGDPVRATPSFTRQSYSAVRVVSIMKEESPDDLPPLPIVPYAVSIAASTAYRRFRQSKLQTHKSRAKEDLNKCCGLLDRLRVYWWSAGAMADLGKAVLSKANHTIGPSTDVQPPRVQGSGKDSLQPGGDANLARDAQVNTSGIELGLPTERTVVSNSSTDFAQVPVQSNVDVDAYAQGAFQLHESPDWLNFDNAFENMDTLLGSSGADLSNELLRPFNYYDPNIMNLFEP